VVVCGCLAGRSSFMHTPFADLERNQRRAFQFNSQLSALGAQQWLNLLFCICRSAAHSDDILEIHVGEILPVLIPDDETRVRFLDGPQRRQAALGHSLRVAKFAKRGFDVAFDVIRCVWIFC
jgi:hypothetical protein